MRHARLRTLCMMTVVTLAAATASTPTTARGNDKPVKRASSHLKLAHTLYEAGRLGEALGAVTEAISADPKYVQAHQLRGMILFNMDQMQDAKKEFEKTLSLDQNYTDARIYLGTTLVHLNNGEEALRAYQKALEDLTYPWPERIHFNIGLLHQREGRTDDAIASFKKSISLNPSYAPGYYELGKIHEGMGRTQEAIRSYTDALVGLDSSADLHLRLGLALMKAGDATKAKEHFEKVIQLAPGESREAVEARDQIDLIKKKTPAS
ncbi:MAG TPA: tetratricopeptide repeat protein [Candidatus Polarisedimenticolia bacterium]|nr:tetratricopeptide repeat protein [Candidatus Polarisedimenticolia bacterium]